VQYALGPLELTRELSTYWELGSLDDWSLSNEVSWWIQLRLLLSGPFLKLTSLICSLTVITFKELKCPTLLSRTTTVQYALGPLELTRDLSTYWGLGSLGAKVFPLKCPDECRWDCNNWKKLNTPDPPSPQKKNLQIWAHFGAHQKQSVCNLTTELEDWEVLSDWSSWSLPSRFLIFFRFIPFALHAVSGWRRARGPQ